MKTNMNMNNDFALRKLDITPNTGVFYHFLDGILNKGYASSFYNHEQLLRDLNLMPGGLCILYRVALSEYSRDEFESEYSSVEVRYLKMMRNDCNYAHVTGTNKHQIVFFKGIVNKKTYFSLINSGDGIRKNHFAVSNSLYNLWNTVEVSDESKFITTLKTLAVMDFIINIKVSNKSSRDQIINKINTFDFIDDSMKSEIIEIFNTGRKSKDHHMRCMNLYYKVIRLHMGDSIATITTLFDEDKIIQFSELWKSKSEEMVLKTNSPIFKRSFETHDGYLLTSPQQSGSCAWFSFFWTIFAHKLTTQSPQEVLDYIVELDSKFMARLNSIMNNDFVFNGLLNVDNMFYVLNNITNKLFLMDC